MMMIPVIDISTMTSQCTRTFDGGKRVAQHVLLGRYAGPRSQLTKRVNPLAQLLE
jgi:hypothetical protein